jgi:N-acyl-D-aspartate/D-glutamate deacylase
MRRFGLLALVLGLAGCAAPESYDLLIENGTVVDGTGAAPTIADLGITGDRIVAVGDLAKARAATVIDATDFVVAPGFIDIHSHADRALVQPEHRSGEGLIRQGVTTAMFGIDGGYSAATIKELNDELSNPGVPINFAFYVGHNGVREEVMGSAPRHATPEEIEAMRGIVRAGMEDGAYGLSSGLMYLPGLHASTEEVIELAKVVAEYGGVYDSHVRDPANDLLASMEECLTIGREAGIPAHPTHVKAVGGKNFGKGPDFVALIQAARDRGENVTVDQYPYDGAATMPLPGILVPPMDSPLREHLRVLYERTASPEEQQAAFAKAVAIGQEAMSDPAQRAAYRKMAENPPDEVFSWIKSVGYSSFRIVVTGHPGYDGQLITEIAETEGRHPFDVIADLIVEEGAGCKITLGAIMEEDVRAIMREPWTMIASDGELGGDHPRGHGTFARVLGRYVREWGVLTLEEAVRKMTSLPAEFLGLENRGRIAPGFMADVVVFDPDTIVDASTWAEPTLYAVGVNHVFTNGVAVLQDGELTGSTPGRRLRKAQ